jgi:hypothetical protein
VLHTIAQRREYAGPKGGEGIGERIRKAPPSLSRLSSISLFIPVSNCFGGTCSIA